MIFNHHYIYFINDIKFVLTGNIGEEYVSQVIGEIIENY